MKRTKTSLLKSALALLLCVSMLIGSTFAWFTDKVTSKGNIIQSGNLDIEMYWTDDLNSGNWYNVEDDAHNTIFSYDKWEPGYTDVKYIKLVNKGNLAMNYKLTLTPQGSVGKLAEVINVFFADKAVDVQSREDLSKLGAIGLLNNVLNGGATANGTLLAKDQYSPLHPSGEVIMTIAMNMITTAGNDYQNQDSGEFTITALATQAAFEKDSFGSDYDSNAEYPTIITGGTVTTQVNAVDGKVPAGGVTMTGNGISAFIPGGIEMAAGADALTLSVTPMEHTTSDITVVNNEILIPVDVHISGIAAGNTTPIVIDLGEVLPKYMNMGNYHLYHVENGANSTMTLVGNEADLTEHNRFTYDPLTGAVKVAMASFSEVALVADTTNPWKGKADYDWYNTTATELTIANADQLYAFAKIVGGMADNYTINDFEGQTVKLLSDINLNGGKATVDGKTKVFYPIGYYNNTSDKIYDRDDVVEPVSGVSSSVSSFSGTFDGNGHTISNFYQNTWEMFGDYNDGYSGKPNYYKDAMGLFGYVLNGTVKNLTVDSFSSDGEFTPTGVIAAYACNSTFENIAITNCEPRVYNTGNGGIVGIGGNSDDPDTYKLTFNNITIDNTNIITALWGSYDVACGGLVGMFRGAGHVDMTNCHVAAQMNVYNDVCGNYQYYWYRYSGMMVGTNKNMITDKDGYTVPETSKFHAENCTVHFGEWNDYYYCEFEKNGHPSYSGPADYKFSRVSLEDLTWDDKNSNKLIDDDERESVKCKHDHTDAENNQAIYLPFNQLFTGYGWGVKHIPVYNGKDYAFEGITILDREEAYSVKKFDYIGGVYLNNEKRVYTIGELFKAAAIEDNKLFIKNENVQVTVSPMDGSNVSGTYVANTSDWTQGTLTFSGSGAAIITITDYYFCQTTTAVVSIIDRKNEAKFETKFTGDFLYRVGNQNNVSLGSLFKQVNGTSTIDSASVTVDIKTLNGNVAGTYTHNATWTNSTIKFEGTGVVAISIQDNDFCNATVLNLEVVDAMNITKAENATSNNVVLLNNVTNGSFSVGSGYAFYGNGFTITLNPNSHTTKRGAGFDGYVHMTGGILDNVRIEGPVFAAANIYREQGETGTGADDPVNYFRNAVIIDSGSNVISNSYISGARTAIYIKGGNDQLIENTTVSGGAYANIEVAVSNKVTFRNLTTEQVSQQDSYSQNKNIVGIGIVIDSNETDVYIEGTLNQYNWITQAQWEAMLGSYASQFPKLFTDSTYQEYWHYRQGDNSTKYVNLSLIFACKWDNQKLHDNRGDKNTTYTTANVTVANMAGGVYSVTNAGTLTSTHMNAPAHTPAVQYPVAPEYNFNHKLEGNYKPYTEGDNVFCYEESGTVKISFNEGESKVWNTSILTVSKLGNALPYKVTMDGNDYTGKSITFSENGNYVVTYTYTDPYNYKLVNGQIISYEKQYSKTVNITVSVVEEQAKNAEFTMGTSNKPVDKIIINNAVYLSAQGIDASTLTNTHTDGMKYSGKTTGSWASKTINGHTFYMPVVAMTTTDNTFKHTGSWYGCFPVFEGAITITDFVDGVETVYNGSTKTKPSTLAALNPQNTFVYQGTASKVPTEPSVPTKGGSKDKLCYTTQTDLSASNERGEMWTIATYTYVDTKGTTYYWYVAYYCAKSENGLCVTPDTLITLADGTQVRVDSLKGDEMLLVWNHETGKMDKAPVAYIVDHEGVVSEREIIHLTFANGKTVKIIGEHVFFDATQNKYVSINSENADELIGHSFAALSTGGTTVEKVELIGVERTVEETLTYEVVSYKHLTCFTEGILSTSAFLDPLLNVFDVDVDTLAYSLEDVQKDIETYGLYTYADFDGLISEEAFELYNAQYLKIAVGKGYITWNDILELIDIYFNVDVKPIQ